MRKIILWILTFGPFWVEAQSVQDHFEKIRNNNAMLTAFFAQMPKGADLHHHYSGSVYAETYFEEALKNNLFLNRETLEIKDTISSKDNQIIYSRLKDLESKGELDKYREQLMQKWSVWHYNPQQMAPEERFFNSFFGFSTLAKKFYATGLNEIRDRAKNEKCKYIECMFSAVRCNTPSKTPQTLLDSMALCFDSKDMKFVQHTLGRYWKYRNDSALKLAVNSYVSEIETMHKDLNIDDSIFTMRYQTYVVRTLNDPLSFTDNVLTCFSSAAKSPLIVGVNILAPEHDPNALKNYNYHMQVFNFCHKLFPEVSISLHAGELTLGLVKPEELNFHITDAINIGSAKRIGHGVDVAHETNRFELLNQMSEQNIAVEINLSSNEFILGVKGSDHPIGLYSNFGVPIVLSSDDAGVLRTNLTHQYVLLASRYPQFSYDDIKEINLNGIRYSFLEDDSKKRLLQELESEIREFEIRILNQTK
ncbi:MAG: adenosine deaminase [Flavobacteriales bacterium]|nr:adenosine deaminase [Flavobacteriales bacterium]